MNRLLTIYISLGITTILFSCKITDAIIDTAGPLPRLPNWGYLTADMNGADWSKTYKNAYQVTHGSTNYADNPKGVFYTLTSILYSPEGYNRQELLFQKIPFFPMPGRHKVASCNSYAGCESSDKPQVALFESLSDGDVAGDFFYTVDSEDNYIQIDSYNAKTQEIKGSFQLTLANARIPRSSDVLPDTLRFRNGRFHTKIIRYKARGE
ncbi:hypothetical protein [Dyadobacter sp. BHUBP1]|uniref:hypothetical protein n=1 Tax=Dyadobacter sp. BHUBP1 TaxID=3424178 RepID=UPI003D32E77E